MSKAKFMAMIAVLVLIAGVAAAQTLQGYGGNATPIKENPEATEQLFRGDLGPELGIGCSNSAGTSGGPNDLAVGVTATLAPPFGIVSTTYNVFTNVGPGTLNFVAWAGGGSPGAVIGMQTGVPDSQANHTAVISPAINVTTPQFFFGLNQPEANAGLRIGVDSGSGGGFSFIRAPVCGAGGFLTLTAVGFPGNWVMAAVIDDMVPVELMSYDVD
jgi:hypothetical protein